MKNQNKTRFEKGMNAIFMRNGQPQAAIVEYIDNPSLDNMKSIYITWGNYAKRITETFNSAGKRYKDDEIITLYTLPEYEALKALTDSFVDGTFGKEQPKFEPQKGEPVIYKGTECHIEGVQNWYILKYPNGFESVRFVSPIEGCPCANGFCIPLLKEEQQDNPIVSTMPFEGLEGGETEKPTPISGEWKETIDLLDENGQPVYFTDGMEVGSLVYGKGKVVDIDIDNGNICIAFPEEGDYWHTFDGRECTGGNQTLYPIEQYAAIQLPKLKPIQVKPKEDVISLPSWFCDGVILSIDDVNYYLKSKSEVIYQAFGKIMDKIGTSRNQCTFYQCQTINGGIQICFVFNSKYYHTLIPFIQPSEVAIAVNYAKNGKNTTEIL